ncbi:hypothetical protein FGG08_001112 [Glutinoglossum americanum]|uniref:Zona occludens toxin N-terminal domain-containing protein n=1 Tax=Glutinoglossum americanum TaxID=1670608 RepID=A0A9P8IBV3_9PEZI|nr:hypothetical protein FGG08_001112 [Glutinoglossum americanum]
MAASSTLSPELNAWVRSQYHIVGIDNKGNFIGSNAFKAKLISAYPSQELAIRQIVNNLNFKPSEAAFLALPNPQFRCGSNVASVTVLVSPSNYLNLRTSYGQIPGVTVHPFKLRSRDLNIGVMLKLMSVDQTQGPPLYMSQVTKVLRGMAAETIGCINYGAFKRHLGQLNLDGKQREFLGQRLDLLESFLDLNGSTTSPGFEAGGVTIIDLSCPFMDANTACVLFQIGMSMYLESNSTAGKAIVVDEAHKYMTDTPASRDLTESLLTVIRQQRHYGVRVIISTQEPTVSPRLIDLCSITVIHRFSSPEWFNVLRKHISIVGEQVVTNGLDELFEGILNLRTGEAIVFAPSAVVQRREGEEPSGKLNGELLKMRMRKRLSWDSGKSIVCI